MCNAASFIVDRHYKVYFHPISDSHQTIIDYFRLQEGCEYSLNFVPVEINPPPLKTYTYSSREKYNLSLPFNKWKFKTDLEACDILPPWYDPILAEEAVRKELPNWFKKLEGARLEEAFKSVSPLKIESKKLSKKHKLALREWMKLRNSIHNAVSVVDSVYFSAYDSVGDSIFTSVGGSVREQVCLSSYDSVGCAVGSIDRYSVEDFVYGYIGSLFPNIKKWKGIKGDNPFKCIRTLWLDGYVPSFNGYKWRLHAGKNATVVFEISQKDLKTLK